MTRMWQWRGAVLAAVMTLGASSAPAQVVMTPGALTDQDKAEISALWTKYRDTLFACKGGEYADLFATPGGYFASAPRGEVRERQALMEMVVGLRPLQAGHGQAVSGTRAAEPDAGRR